MFKRIVVGAGIAAASWIGYVSVRRWWSTWGVDQDEQTKTLPGDELIAEGRNLLTRGITIDAPPEAVWPWLVQMGYGRAGWYSYDRLDMKGTSAEGILPEHQVLEVGDTVPTHPDGGFEVKLVEPDRVLALYVDTELVESWQKPAESISKKETPGLAMSGGMMSSSMPQEFKVSWTFVLEPAGPGRTRLIERTRGWFGAGSRGSKAALPLLGFGVFVMTQRQMVEIKRRAERSAGLAKAERDAVAVPMTTIASNGVSDVPIEPVPAT